MAWFASKVTLSTIVSQGLEHVHKLKDDVEKQFDDAVSGGKPPMRPAGDVFAPAPSPPRGAPAPSPPRSNPTASQAHALALQGTPTAPRSSEGNKAASKPRDVNFFSEWNLGPPTLNGKRDIKPPGVTFPSAKRAPAVSESATSPTTDAPLPASKGSTPVTNDHETAPSADAASNAAALDYIKTHSVPIDVACVSLPPADDKSPDDETAGALSIASTASTVLTESDERPSTTSSLQSASDAPSPDVEALQAELTKTQVLLGERENQLLAASSKLTKLMEELDSARSSVSSDAVVAQLQHALAEKEEQLAQLLGEGQALSVKQGQYEARLRALRKENNELADEHAQTVAALETTQAKWETARSHLVQAEDERKASLAKIKQLESSHDELCAALEALDAANTKVTALEEQQAQWHADKSALEASASAAADSELLESTLAEMQKRTAAIEADAARREELARHEIAAWKKRYQDAVHRMDSLAEETSGAASPLLRQLTQLQQEHQQRELFWRTFQQSADVQLQAANLQVRTLEAQVASEVSTRRGLEEHIETWQMQIHSVQTQLEQATARIRTLEEDESAHEAELTRLRRQVVTLEAEKSTAPPAPTISNSDAALASELQRSKEKESALIAQVRQLEQQLADRRASSFRERKSSSEFVLTERSGDVSLVEWHQLQQKVRLRESEAALLKQQVQELEELKTASGQTIATMQARIAALEGAEAELATTKAALEAVTVRQNVLLELLGEKEEQLDELETEFRECKRLYQSQIDTLTRDRA
ncbi:hypothetical protein ACHHYP_09888 [Achlya hypogyna]|uniref:TATA element modulatory factor 1 TATA binding domain-containing protein n=1 Tax=Achlya hypogyna TaxID=1202772 RepID=A0A1V9ZIM9_ACHHY|nr:hypothetical protein ACHHYP_09888 [Achlya hypogyna]